jgi:hypothetical protein
MDYTEKLDKVYMPRIIEIVLAANLSGHLSILAQPFVRGDRNKFLP